jgi:peroxiredoxin
MSAFSAELPIRHVRTSVAIGGNADKGKIAINHRLAEALKKGPVVLYFYPKSFTDVSLTRAAGSPHPSRCEYRPGGSGSGSIFCRKERT